MSDSLILDIIIQLQYNNTMKSSGKICGWIAVGLVIVLIAGMILSIVLLSETNKEDWEYYTTNNAFDYYSFDTSSADFQYVSNFKHAVSTYFGSLINDNISKIFPVEKALESQLEAFAERVVAAMASARVSAIKLNKIAECLNDNSLGSFYGTIRDFIVQFEDFDTMEAYIYEHIGDYTLFAFLRKILSDFMYRTGITENEIASFLYFYLTRNSDDKYVSALTLMGQDYFERLLSDTIYVLVRFGSIKESEFMFESTAQSTRAVLYQLGSLYVEIENIPDGVDTVERILHINRSYDETFSGYEELNSLSERIKGKTGELFVLLGYFMRAVEASDISAYFDYLKTEEGKQKTDAYIYAAILLSKKVKKTLQHHANNKNETSSITNYSDRYMQLLNDLQELSIALLSSVTGSESESEVKVDEEFARFGRGCVALCDLDYSLDDIGMVAEGTEEYVCLKESADDFFRIKAGFSSIISYMLMIGLIHEANSYITTGE